MRKLTCLLILKTIVVGSLACQTIETVRETKDENKDKEVLGSQLNIVVNYLNKGEASKAHAEIRNILETHPENTDALNIMGLTQLALRNPKQAERYLRQAYDIEAKHSYGLNLTSSLIEQKKYKDAYRILKGLAARKNEYQFPERVYHNMGLVWEKANQLKLATKYYRKALLENPNSYPTLIQLAKVYERRKKNPEAIITYERATSACPTCLEPAKLLAMGHLASGNTAKAVEVLNKFTKVKGISSNDRRDAGTLAKTLKTSKAEVIIR